MFIFVYLTLTNSFWDKYYYHLNFIDEETEAQKNFENLTRVTELEAVKLKSRPIQTISRDLMCNYHNLLNWSFSYWNKSRIIRRISTFIHVLRYSRSLRPHWILSPSCTTLLLKEKQKIIMIPMNIVQDITLLYIQAQPVNKVFKRLNSRIHTKEEK